MKKLIGILLMTFLGKVEAFVPSEAHTFEFNIEPIRMGRQSENKLFEGVELLRMVFSSEEFKMRILKHRFNERYAFSHNKGLSNRRIYNLLLKGTEKLFPYENNAMDVEVELYSDYRSQVLGYTMTGSRRIWMNKKYFNKHSPAEVASHLTHEWLHKLGFHHEKERTENRKYSVPYAIGYIVKDLAREFEYENYHQKRSYQRERGIRSPTYHER
ncbi:MAG: hypothetical protein ACLGHN_05575 [Bacteriovoracia bacterium]